jgi:peptide/nickel transport system substrate-binding protein
MIIDAQKQAAPQVPVFPIVAPDSLVFLGKRVSGVPASWCYNYYPWARDLGAA